ncbi:hypothetical protein [Azomonas macrocytogenes]|uniref:Uncharacterized protein n=1 Tax=Azomonas macrocytogenes TaxID=69962 RepID=A0A839T1U3_AZOMA|nr:hypothetical protein [Azomonas macrocytogenes]MBB3103511.1 hypothetical protein [Azomonas macrocytogenes]
MKRLLKKLLIGVFTCVTVLLALPILFPASTSPLETSWESPQTGAKITIQLTQTHPFLAEYERKLVFRTPDGVKIEQLLFPDPGGYVRTQLYRASDEVLYLKGYFDLARLSAVDKNVSRAGQKLPEDAVYLGAFDFDKNASRQWRFLPSSESPEQPLVPQGG